MRMINVESDTAGASAYFVFATRPYTHTQTRKTIIFNNARDTDVDGDSNIPFIVLFQQRRRSRWSRISGPYTWTRAKESEAHTRASALTCFRSLFLLRSRSLARSFLLIRWFTREKLLFIGLRAFELLFCWVLISTVPLPWFHIVVLIRWASSPKFDQAKPFRSEANNIKI